MEHRIGDAVNNFIEAARDTKVGRTVEAVMDFGSTRSNTLVEEYYRGAVDNWKGLSLDSKAGFALSATAAATSAMFLFTDPDQVSNFLEPAVSSQTDYSFRCESAHGDEVEMLSVISEAGEPYIVASVQRGYGGESGGGPIVDGKFPDMGNGALSILSDKTAGEALQSAKDYCSTGPIQLNLLRDTPHTEGFSPNGQRLLNMEHKQLYPAFGGL